MTTAEVLGIQTPRIEVIPEGTEHPQWADVLDFIERLGVELDPWQRRVLWTALLRGEKFWAAFVVAVCCPRQNGKNAILEIRELIGPCLLGEELIIHSAHRADTSMEGFRRLDDLIDANSWLSKDVRHIRRQNGHEQITFKNGKRIRFRTRTGGGGRGFSGSPLMLDESMYLSELSMSSLVPVISAQPDPQVWHMGSAVDQMIHDEGVVFARVRERALSGEDPRLAYFEWSLDVQTPDEVTLDQSSSPESWAKTNPALGVRIMPDYIAAELHELGPRGFAVERLGVGDWPKTDGTTSVIDMDLWHSLIDPNSKAPNPVAFAFDVRPDRSAGVIGAVGRRTDGNLHLEIIDQREGTGWMVGRIVELERKHMPLGVVCDGIGPAASLVPELKQQNVDVSVLSTPEMCQACGMFYDSVAQSTARHLGQQELLVAIKGATQRPLGDAWAWSRRNSTSDISPLVACTLGVWKVITEEQHAPMFAFG